MNYQSLNKKASKVSFKDAVINGIAPDMGLYFPDSIQTMGKDFFENIHNLSNHEMAYEVIKQFVNSEIPDEDLKKIVADTLNFDFPVVEVEKNIAALELYHGPTMAFKDVGARFMARCLGHFNNASKNTKVTILVATSGDTGGAVASGFLGVSGVDVVILYPSGKVSEVQEKQLTTFGENIQALEVNGTFDDCQDMVKKAFLDNSIIENINLTSANSINVARWLPQMFYFFFAYKQLKEKGKKLVFSVPSGNYGNICAGMMAQKIGLPISHFIAATNVNNVVPEYLNSGEYNIKPSVRTISNAMDVGNPSNFIRIEELHDHNLEKLRGNLSGFSFTDEETKLAMDHLFNSKNYTTDPHGAIGYLALKEYLKKNGNMQGVFLETAHPIKFLDVLSSDMAVSIEIPDQIKKVLGKTKEATSIGSYDQLKQFLLA